MTPESLAAASTAVKARMQGKSCFQCSKVDSALFEELSILTRSGYASDREQGFVP